MDRDEVGLAHELIKRHEAHADLGCARGLHVGVIGDELDAERRESLGHQHADTTEADDADRLLRELNAVVLRSLPLTVLECEIGRDNIARG